MDASARPFGASKDTAPQAEQPLPAWLWSLLALVIAAAAATRLWSDPWIAHQAPAYARLLEGQLVLRDTAVFHGIVSLVAGQTPYSTAWISNDHYRGWIPIYLWGVLYHWTGSVFWSVAAIDLLSWFGAAVCLFRLAQRLGVSVAGAALAAIFCAVSPVFTNQAWMNLVHLANTASLVWGTHAVLLVLDRAYAGRAAPLRQGLLLGGVLYGCSLLYSYVWLIVPSAAAIVAVEGSWAYRLRRAAALAASIVVFGGLTVATQRALAAAGWPLFVQANDPVAKVALLVGQAMGAPAETGGAAGALGRLALSWLDPRHMAAVFHPLPLVLGGLGMAMGGARLRAAGAVATLLALVQGTTTAVPWVVSNNYPYVYAGAGAALVEIGRAAGRALNRYLSARAAAAVAAGVTGLLTALAILATNVDVLGDFSYVRGAWGWLGFPI